MRPYSYNVFLGRGLRRMKHEISLILSRITHLADNSRRAISRARPYLYDPEKYKRRVYDVVVPNSATFPVNHLQFGPSTPSLALLPAPNILYCLWTGTNEMSKARRDSIQALRAVNPDTPLILITVENISDYVVEEHPLHPAWSHLSYVHRSDYLRAYIMHHHGGAYADIKRMNAPFKPIIDRINACGALWAGGPAELNSFNSSPAFGRLGRDQRLHFSQMVCQAAFVFKPGTEWTREWIEEIERRLDYFSRILPRHPAEQPYGRNSDYPIPWSALQGYVFSPLALKYRKRAFLDPAMRFIYSEEYR